MSVLQCDEIQVFEQVAEKTGNVVDLGGLKREPRVCTTVSDLVRKHRQYGDGHYYLPLGQWPSELGAVKMDELRSKAKKK